ncbi:MAG: DUF3102 domain-containing protein [Methylococcales bacterium]|nr:DUF3102 domain-containing protein [Methylococcales bacterium]
MSIIKEITPEDSETGTSHALTLKDNKPIVTKLERLAGEINADFQTLENMQVNLLVIAAKLGEKIAIARDVCGKNFNFWLNENCSVKRSQAYNYMRIAKEMPELLDDSVHSSGQKKLELTQAIVLLNAPDEVKESVAERVEAGENVTVAEINYLKKEAKEAKDAEMTYKRTVGLLKSELKKVDAENLKVSDDLADLKNQQQANIDEAINSKMEAEKAVMQQEVDKLVAQVSSDYEDKINHQTDKISELRNQLANPDAEKLDAISQQIAAAEMQLLEIEQNRLHDDYDDIFCGHLKRLMAAYLEVSTALLSRPQQHNYHSETQQFIKRSHDNLKSLAVELKNQLEIKDA